MATLSNLSTFSTQFLEASLYKGVRRDKTVYYVVSVHDKLAQHEYDEIRTKNEAKAQEKFDEIVQAIKDGWHP